MIALGKAISDYNKQIISHQTFTVGFIRVGSVRLIFLKPKIILTAGNLKKIDGINVLYR